MSLALHHNRTFDVNITQIAQQRTRLSDILSAYMRANTRVDTAAADSYSQALLGIKHGGSVPITFEPPAPKLNPLEDIDNREITA